MLDCLSFYLDCSASTVNFHSNFYMVGIVYCEFSDIIDYTSACMILDGNDFHAVLILLRHAFSSVHSSPFLCVQWISAST